MSKQLFIKRVSDGEIRLSKWQDVDSEFWWTEGNASCDCNRAIAFGTPEDNECGDSRYKLVNEDGSEFIDWDETKDLWGV